MPDPALSIDTEPAVKELRGDAEGIAEIPDCSFPQEICSEDPKDEGQGILAVRNNEVGKYGMGTTAAFAFDPAYTHHALIYMVFQEVDQKAVVGCEETTMPGCTAGRTYFCLRYIFFFKSREYRFCV